MLPVISARQSGWVFLWLLLFLSALAVVLAFVYASGPPGLLWVADTRAISMLDRDTGRTHSRITLKHDLRAFTLERETRTVWALSGQELSAHKYDGAPKMSSVIDVSLTGRAAIAALPQGRQVWLAVGSEVLLLDGEGRRLWSRPLPGAVVDIVLEERRSWLWAASRNELALYDAQGRLILQISMAGSAPVRALDYDPVVGEVWVVADRSIQRYSWEGNQTFARSSYRFAELVHLAADGRGGLWAASTAELTHIDATGTVDLRQVRRAAKASDPIVDLIADAGGKSIWVASRRGVGRYSRAGMLFTEFGRADNGSGPPVVQLALDTPVRAGLGP